MNANANAVIQTLSDDALRAIDTILLIDHSASMGEASIRRSGITRFEELEEDTVGIAREAEKYDADGLTVIAFSSAVRMFDGVKADTVKQVFKEVAPRGSTNLAEALQAAFAKAESTQKQTVVLVFTDGVPDNDRAVFDIVNSYGNKLGRPRVGVTFIQVGEEPKATAFLDTLNAKLSVDIVAVAHAKQAEGLSLGQLAWMAQNQ
jgi:Mg-chelatase subunit ChlD